MAPASELTHMVLPQQGGDRYSHIWLTKANVIDLSQHNFFYNNSHYTNGYKQKAGLSNVQDYDPHWVENRNADLHGAEEHLR